MSARGKPGGRGAWYSLAYVAGLAGLVTAGSWQLSQGSEVTARADWTLLALASMLQLAGTATAVGIWRKAVQASCKVTIGWRPALQHVCFNLVTKYIPGKVWGLALRHHMLASEVGDNGRAARALVTEQMAFIATGGLLSLPALVIMSKVWIAGLGTMVILGLAFAMMPLLPGARSKLRWLLLETRLLQGFPTVLGLSVAQWLMTACSALLVAGALGVHMDFQTAVLLGSAVPAAFIIGMAAFFIPAGIGVREGAFVLLCGHHIGVAEAFACALALRLLATGRDVVCGFVIPLNARYARIAHEA